MKLNSIVMKQNTIYFIIGLMMILVIVIAVCLYKKSLAIKEESYLNSYMESYENNDDFELKSLSQIETNKPTVILAYANWCPHCESVLPIWNEVCQKYKNNSSVFVTQIEEKNQNFESFKKSHKDINSFPTIIAIKNGKSEEFEGNRDKESMISFIEQQIV
jgi:thiol-disulfide isomerase/thioredoxin